MTITIEIEQGIDAIDKDQLRQAFAGMGMSRQGEPLVLGDHVFEYYTLHEAAAINQVLDSLRSMKGVAAAYTQPASGLPG